MAIDLDILLANTRPNGECREWVGAHAKSGCGLKRIDGVLYRVPRLVWEALYGSIPEGKLICHTCDNPPCIEPTHLWLGTPSQNMLDASAKDRLARKGGRYIGSGIGMGAGERNGMTTLTTKQVHELRTLRAQGMTYAELGALFGVHLSTAFNIANQRTWRYT